MIDIDIHAPDMNKIRKSLGTLEKNAPTVLVRAINRAAITAKSTIRKQSTGVPALYRVKPSVIDRHTKNAPANKNNLKAVVTFKGYPRPLSLFAMSPKRIVSYKGKSRSPKRYKASTMKKHPLTALDKEKNKPFVAVTTKGNFMGIFSRTGEYNKVLKEIEIIRKVKPRKKDPYTKVYKYKKQTEKLRMHYGPSIPQMVDNKILFKKMELESSKTLNNRINHEIELLLRRMG